MAIEENNPKKSQSISFRLPDHLISEIKKEAKIKLISTNALISQILSQYVNWDRYEERIRMFPVPKDSFQHILNHLDEIRRDEAVDIIFNAIRDWTLVSRKKFDLHNCLSVMEDYCRMVGVTVEEGNSSGFRTYVVRHNLGKNVSCLVDELISKIFWELVKVKVDSDITESTVVAKLCSRVD
jgi:hypothetical protein